jgi:hypothetical protein
MSQLRCVDPYLIGRADRSSFRTLSADRELQAPLAPFLAEVWVRHEEGEFYYHTSTSSHPRMIRTTLRDPGKNLWPHRELSTHSFAGVGNHITVVRHNEEKNATGKTEFEFTVLTPFQKLDLSPCIRLPPDYCVDDS